jgi:signal transduction histidine kinase
MDLYKPEWKVFRMNIYYMIFFGLFSFILSTITFSIPGIEGAASDLAEIPLLIGVFYITNPLYLIGSCLISAMGFPSDGSYLSTFLMHSVALIITWYFFQYLRKNKHGNIALGIIWAIYTIIYYLVILVPISIITNWLVGLNTGKGFFDIYFGIITSLRFEIVASALITALYLIQHEIRTDLQRHKDNLEILVKERTEELALINEELRIKNNELSTQKEELTSTLENLKNTQTMLIQSEKMASLGTLTSGIAHEINNPLNFISGGNYILKNLEPQVNDSLSDESKDLYSSATSMIQDGFQRASDIVQSLMTFSYKGKPILVPADINKIIDNTLLFISHEITPEVLIHKDYKLQKDVPVYQDKIHQVLLNILDNALFATRKNSKAGTREIFIQTDQSDKYAIIKISNNGRKIPDEHLKQIFDPFFTTKNPGEGAGLGLSICYTLIKEHKGNIRVENEEDAVAFVIEVPLNK